MLELISNNSPEQVTDALIKAAVTAIERIKEETQQAIWKKPLPPGPPYTDEKETTYQGALKKHNEQLDDLILVYGGVLAGIRDRLTDDQYRTVLRKLKIKIKDAENSIDQYNLRVSCYNNGLHHINILESDGEINIDDTGRYRDSVSISIEFVSEADIPRLYDTAMKEYQSRKERIYDIRSRVSKLLH